MNKVLLVALTVLVVFVLVGKYLTDSKERSSIISFEHYGSIIAKEQDNTPLPEWFKEGPYVEILKDISTKWWAVQIGSKQFIVRSDTIVSAIDSVNYWCDINDMPHFVEWTNLRIEEWPEWAEREKE